MELEKQRRCTLLAGVGHFMCLGLMYSWSKFAGQIRAELGFDHAGITLAYSLCMAMFTLGILSDGLLSRRLSSRSCALLGICVSAGGYALTSLVPPGWALLIYGTYGLCYGGAATLGANYIAAVFGRKHYRRNNGVSAATALPANLGATAAIALVRDASGSYLPFFRFALPAALAAGVLAWCCRKLVARRQIG